MSAFPGLDVAGSIRQPGASLAARLLICLCIQLAGCEGTTASQFAAVARIPTGFLPTGIACGRPLVLFGESSELLSVRTQAEIYRLDTDTRTLQRVYARPDARVLGFSAPTDGSLIALVGGSANPQLLRSLDGGRSWEELSRVPPNIFGAAFISRDSGFAWSGDSVYFTYDGARTWKSAPMVGVFSGASPQPVVDQSLVLWVATFRPKGPGSDLVAVDSDLVVRREISSDDKIARMTGGAEDVWFVLQEGGYGRILISRLRTEDGPPAERVAELNKDLPIDYAARGEHLAILLSDTSRGSERYVMASANGGSTWMGVKGATNDSLQCACIGEEGELWVAGRRHLWSSPLGQH